MARNAIQQLQNDYAELFAGKEIRETEDGKYSVYDYIDVMTGSKNARIVFKRLCEQYPDVVTGCYDTIFPRRDGRKGTKPTPVTDRQGLLMIHGLLPGVAGANYRQNAADVIERFLRADVTLAEQIIAQTEDNTTRAAVIATDRLNNDQDRQIVAENAVDTIQDAEVVLNVAVKAEARSRYINSYHRLHDTIRENGGEDARKRKNLPWTQRYNIFAIVNKMNTLAVGEVPVGTRNHYSYDKYNELSVLQDMEQKRIEKYNLQGNDEIRGGCEHVSDLFMEFARKALA